MIIDTYELNKKIYSILDKFNTKENGFVQKERLLLPNTVIIDDLAILTLSSELDDYWCDLSGLVLYIDSTNNINCYNINELFDLSVDRNQIFTTEIKQAFLPNNDKFVIDNNTLYSKDYKIAYISFDKSPILDERVEVIYDLFYRNNRDISSVTIPCNVISVLDYTFENCTNLTEVKFNNTKPLDIWYGAFRGCDNLISVDLNNVKQLADNSFANCKKLTTVKLHNTTDKICPFSFQDDISLSAINIEDTSLSLLEYCTFNNCSSLTSLTLPSTIKNIDMSVFNNCTNLQLLNLSALNTNIQTGIYKNSLPNSLKIVVPNNLYSTFKETEFILNREYIVPEVYLSSITLKM